MNRKLVVQINNIVDAALGIYDLAGFIMINSFCNLGVVVDLGAGKGEFSERLLEKSPSSRIILVEPDPSLFRELEKKFETQDNIEVFEAAIGNEENKNRKFYLNKNWMGNSLYESLIPKKDIQGEIIIRTVTLKSIFSLFHIEKIDLLKVNIEGGEWELFENFSMNDFNRIEQIVVQFHDFLDPSQRRGERCVKLLKEFGYTFVQRGTNPYSNCLFYDRKRLKSKAIVKWLTVPRQLSAII